MLGQHMSIVDTVVHDKKPTLLPCDYRESREVEASCKCGTYIQMYCNKLKLPVGASGCTKCQKDPNWIIHKLLKGESDVGSN